MSADTKRLLTIRELSSPNCNDRKDGAGPHYLILHYTGTITAKIAEDHYMNVDPGGASGPVSPHYMVDIDGAITRFVPEDKRAWHAGVSSWDGVTDMNSHSVGIEIVNPGHDGGYRVFPVAQMRAVIDLCRDIVTRNDIPAANVLAHSDIAPLRKKDPGELFDWKLLAASGIGLWPQPERQDYVASAHWAGDEKLLTEAFESAGYDASVPLAELVTAFQRHFHPEVFASRDKGEIGVANAETAARLHCLQRRRKG